jgi:hypothetical protein
MRNRTVAQPPYREVLAKSQPQSAYRDRMTVQVKKLYDLINILRNVSDMKKWTALLLVLISPIGAQTLAARGAVAKSTAPSPELSVKGDLLRDKVLADWLLQDAGVKHEVDFSRASDVEKKLVLKVLSECAHPPKLTMQDLRADYIRACEHRRAERLATLRKKSPQFVFVKQNHKLSLRFSPPLKFFFFFFYFFLFS